MRDDWRTNIQKSINIRDDCLCANANVGDDRRTNIPKKKAERWLLCATWCECERSPTYIYSIKNVTEDSYMWHDAHLREGYVRLDARCAEARLWLICVRHDANVGDYSFARLKCCEKWLICVRREANVRDDSFALICTTRMLTHFESTHWHDITHMRWLICTTQILWDITHLYGLLNVKDNTFRASNILLILNQIWHYSSIFEYERWPWHDQSLLTSAPFLWHPRHTLCATWLKCCEPLFDHRGTLLVHMGWLRLVGSLKL